MNPCAPLLIPCERRHNTGPAAASQHRPSCSLTTQAPLQPHPCCGRPHCTPPCCSCPFPAAAAPVQSHPCCRLTRLAASSPPPCCCLTLVAAPPPHTHTHTCNGSSPGIEAAIKASALEAAGGRRVGKGGITSHVVTSFHHHYHHLHQNSTRIRSPSK